MGNDDSGDRLVAITSKVSPELREQIDTTSKPEESRSAAIRRLVRIGLEEQADPNLTDRIGFSLTLIFMTGFPTLAAANGQMDLATFFIGALGVLALFNPQLQQVSRKIGDALP